jgi:hypothetical protein
MNRRNNMKSRLMLTTTAILLVVFLLSLFWGLAKPASASLGAAPGDPFAIYLPIVLNKFPVQTIFGAEMGNITTAGGLTQMAATNMTWTRRNAVEWSSVESTKGTYNWSAIASLESELKNASQNGFQVILIVRGTPSWAQKTAGSSCGPIRSTELATFGNFMQALVARYSVHPYNVKYWEMWNEQDIAVKLNSDVYGCWGDSTDAYYGGGYYAEMLKATYPKIKAADSQAQVLLGGLLLDCDPRAGMGCETIGHDTKPPKFLEGILRNNGGAYFDGISFHAYDYYYKASGHYGSGGWESAWNTTGPALIKKVEFIQSVLAARGVSGKYLINTESALVCDACISGESAFETNKAYYMAQNYAAAISLGLRANLWYSAMGWRNSNLLNADLSPLPAYTAFQFARSELREATFVQNITTYTGVKGYEFQRGDRRIWVIWSLDGTTHTTTLPGVPLAAWDALGASVTPAASMDITLNPLYLEWTP